MFVLIWGSPILGNYPMLPIPVILCDYPDHLSSLGVMSAVVSGIPCNSIILQPKGIIRNTILFYCRSEETTAGGRAWVPNLPASHVHLVRWRIRLRLPS